MNSKRILCLVGIILGLTFPVYAQAATTITVTPVTWNIIGLDSNNVSVGPNHFPVGARVCNTGGSTATNVTATFNWDTTPSPNYINIRPGTNATVSLPNIPSTNPDTCVDAYFEVEVTRDAAAYNTKRSYHISVSADSGATTGSTVTPRELYVEHLISQSRNSVSDMQLAPDVSGSPGTYASIAAGGTMTLMVGNTYWIKLVGATATQGYDQIESFINFPNTIFQVLAVDTTYTAETSGNMAPPYDKLYGDACQWENDPASPNYRACLSTGKAGGDVTVSYRVKILSIPGSPMLNPEPLGTLIYDFSGSSFHYNGDYGVSARYADVVNASLTKSFAPKSVTPGGTSTLTFTITNPGSAALTNVNFTDTLPLGITVTTGTSSQCGGTNNLTLTHNTSSTQDTIALTGATVAGFGTCTFNVTVTGAVAGNYTNTTGHLFINSTIDTNSAGSDTLNVTSLPAAPASCGSSANIATWSLENYTAGTSTQNGPFTYSAKAASIATSTTATYGALSPSTSGIANTTTGPTGWALPSTSGATANSWGIHSGWLAANPGSPTTASTPYFQFQVDGASDYGGFGITLNYNMQGNWSNSGNWYVLSSTDGSTWSNPGTGAWSKANSWQSLSTSTTITSVNTVYFRVYFAGAQNATATVYIDNINVTGCPRPLPPTLTTKSFGAATIAAGSNTTMRLVMNNPNASTTLTNVQVDDTFPTGITLQNTTFTFSPLACGTVTKTSGAASAAGDGAVRFKAATLAGSASCQVDMNVTASAAGQYHNVTDTVTSTETGPNTTAAGYKSADLTVVAPPVIAKTFGSTFIYTGNTTPLTFTITNPNSSAMSSIGFSDTLTAGLSVANGTFSVCGGVNNLTTTAATRVIQLLTSGGGVTPASLTAGSSCSFSVTVTGSSPGNYTNNTGTVSGTVSTLSTTGNIASASLSVRAQTPGISVLKQAGLTSSGPWTSFVTVPTPLPQSVYFQFTIENTGDTTLNNVRINDLTFPGLDVSACNIASLVQYASQTCVAGPVTVSATGTYTNTANATSNTATSANSTAQYATAGLLLTKNVTESSFTAAGNVLHYTFNVYNNSSSSLNGPITVADDKATDESCPNMNTVGNYNSTLDPGEGITCTATYTVTGPVGTPGTDMYNGYVTNTATASSSAPGAVTSNTATRTVLKSGLPDLRVTDGNNVNGSVTMGDSFNWTLMVMNAGLVDATFAAGQTILRVPFPAGATYGSPTVGNFTNITNSGNISCSIDGSNVLTCTASSAAVTIGALNGSFTVTVPVTTSSSASGNLSNTATVDPNGNVTESNESNNTGSDTVAVHPKAVNDSGATYENLILDSSAPDAGNGQSVSNANILTNDTGTGITLTSVTGSGLPCSSFACTITTAHGSVVVQSNGTYVYSPNVDYVGSDSFTYVITDSSGLTATGTVNLTITSNPTLVFLTDFRAYESNGEVFVRWETASERNTLGFDLFRLDPATGEYRPVNSGLLPSMLNPHRGGVYTLRDKGASAGGTYTYKIVEVENSGSRLTYGPITLSVSRDAGVDAAGFASSSDYSRMERADAGARKSALKAGSSAQAARLSMSGSKGSYSTLIKIAVAEKGVYFVDAADIATVLGLPSATVHSMIDQGMLSMSNQGVETAYLPAADNSGLYFYGEGIDSVYTKENIYWIRRGKGALMPVLTGEAPKSSALPAVFPETLHFEKDLIPWETLFNSPDADYWFWDRMFASSGYTDPPRNFLFSAPGLSAAENTATISVNLFGGSDAGTANDHHVVVSVNGKTAGEGRWSGLTAHTITVTAPLNPGDNTLTVTGVADSGVSSFVLIDSFDVAYQRLYEADANALSFLGSGSGTVTVDGFTTPGILVMDITNPRTPALNTATTIEPSAAGYEVTLNTASANTPYIAVAGNAVIKASLKAAGDGLALKKSDWADYIIIVPEELAHYGRVLSEYRMSQGLKTLVVNVEDIMDEFNHGISSPEAIKRFLTHAYNNGKTRPRYVVLAGSGSLDYKNNLGLGGSPVPTMMVPSLSGLAASDNALGDVDGDHVPEIAVGRLPVSGPEELLTVINKIKRYESGGAGNRLVLLADTPDGGGNFIADSDAIGALFPAAYPVSKLYLTAPSLVDTVRSELFTVINSGSSFLNYVGHAGPYQLSYSGLLSHYPADDLPQLTNSGSLPVMTAMTCDTGNFSNPFSAVLSEALMLKNNGGVAAVWAPTTLSDNGQAKILDREFYSAFISGGKRSLGEAVLQALSEYKKKGSMPFMIDIYNILGDPALKLR